MSKLHSKSAKIKVAETKSNNLPQMSDPTERESHIIVDYPSDTVRIYTNHITVINRLARAGYDFETEEYLNGEVYSRTYVFPMNMLAKFATSTIFK